MLNETRSVAVVLFRGQWCIHDSRNWRGQFDYSIDAIEAAMRLAERMSIGSDTVKVVVQDRFGELREHPARLQ